MFAAYSKFEVKFSCFHLFYQRKLYIEIISTISWFYLFKTTLWLHWMGKHICLATNLRNQNFWLEASWWSGYYYCTTSIKKAWSQVLRWFKFSSWRVGYLRRWEFPIMVPTENLSPVNHSTERIYDHHFHHHHYCPCRICRDFAINFSF